MKSVQIFEGRPDMLGAAPLKDGVNFAVYSKNASRVVLELFEKACDKQPTVSIELDPVKNRTGSVWHVFVKGLKANALYLYRVDGEYNPTHGNRFNFNKYLLDPYAKAFTEGSVFRSYNLQMERGLAGIENGKLSDLSDFPKCVVIDDNDFDWQGDRPLNYPLNKTILYEVHLKGFTASPTSGVAAPGTYKGFMEKIPHLKELGITSVEFLPVFEFDEDENGNINPKTGEKLSNYWGYSTIGFFAPKTTFASDKTPGQSVREFKELVRHMHKAGLEVILDVVFNHTAEGNEYGYSFSFKGLENAVYYLLPYHEKQYYMNYAGCGNSINAAHPVVTRFILDCLRYWVSEMHIDGFRFDLASVLTRDQYGNIQGFPFLTNAIAEDPVLARTKIIAEPWDAGGGYHVGNFPGGRWSEWNDRFRNDIRRFVRGDEGGATAAATRIAGSSDLYNHSGRLPTASINFITSHDGFTLNDLVSYNGKHNDENGESNRDGSDDNNSYNHGFEGEAENPKIEQHRIQSIKNFVLCLMISQGVPMMTAGDEFRRTQNGNNNAYCQDNEISWLNWDYAERNAEILHFTRQAIALRKNHPVFTRCRFFSEHNPEIEWFDIGGRVPDWNSVKRFLAFRLNGCSAKKDDGSCDNDFYIAANTDIYDVTVTLPALAKGKKWRRVADTSIKGVDSICFPGKEELLAEQRRYVLPAHAFLVLMAADEIQSN